MSEETPLASRALRLVVLGLVAGLLIPPAADGQRRRVADETVTESTEVLAVEVPVQVLRDGEPVRGLTEADFEVVEGRKKQPLIGFDVVDLSTVDGGRFWGDGDTKSIPLAARRHFLLLFDLSFSDPTAIVRARQGAKDLVLQSLHPADMAGVVTFSQSRGVQLILNFTSDRRQMLEAIDGLGVSDPLDVPNTDPLRMTIDTLVSRLDQLGDTGTGGADRLAGGAFGQDDRLQAQLAALQDTQRMAAVSVREQKQSQIQGYMDAMSQVGQMLRQAKGTKHVVLLSEGFDSTVLAERHDLLLADRALVELPVEVGGGEEESLAGNRGGDRRRDGRSRLPVSSVGQLERVAGYDRPTAHHRIAELELGVPPEAAGSHIRRVAVQVSHELPQLVDPGTEQHLLKGQQIRIEACDPIPDQPQALLPGSRVVPEVQGQDLERHCTALRLHGVDNTRSGARSITPRRQAARIACSTQEPSPRPEAPH